METKMLEARLADEPMLKRVYGEGRLEEVYDRCKNAIKGFRQNFPSSPVVIYSAPGRTEIGGNHTDHQHGCVLAAAVDLDVLAVVDPRGDAWVNVMSEGYPMIEVNILDSEPKQEEKNTSAALIRGVAARIQALGCQLGGFNAYITSMVPGGSGLSSSAAFEVLIGTIFNDLYCDGKWTPVEIAQIGQYAENVYFGKPCGLMDQMASSVGGVVAIDFRDPEKPEVEAIQVNLAAYGYALCILDSGADHADLTAEYAAITEELKAVCGCFGKRVLREIPEEEFMEKIPEVRKTAGDRAVLRALHVYAENRRAVEEADALRSGDFARFLSLVRDSGRSSAVYLQNVVPCGQYRNQELQLTIALCEQILNGRGAVRVHGGGFGGTAQAFVPLDLLSEFKTRTEAVLGEGACHVLNIRPVGGSRVV